MSVIGFHFKSISAEKKKSATGKINVQNNVVLTEVKEAKVNMGDSNQKGIEFTFHYKIRYKPEVASMDFKGAVVYLGTEKKVNEILKKWDSDNNLDEDVAEEVYNHLLSKSNVEALIIGRDMQLPPHIPLPKLEANKKDKD